MKKIMDWEGYRQELINRLGIDNKLIRTITQKARQNPKRVVFAESDHYKILKAAQVVRDEGIAKPILLGNAARIKKLMEENNLDLEDIPIIDPRSPEEQERLKQYGDLFFEKRKRRGFTQYEARQIMRERIHFGTMMVETGAADAMISGLTRKYADPIRAALHIIGVQEGVRKVAGMYIILTKYGPFFFADATVNVNPDAQARK